MDEILIDELIEADYEIGFFHGTKEKNLTEIKRNGLQPGYQARPIEHEFVRETWTLLAKALNIEISSLQSDMVSIDPRLAGGIVSENAVELGTSIRILNMVFDYQGIAFAGTFFAAQGYAEEGSEATAACRALYKFALAKNPAIAHRIASNSAFSKFTAALGSKEDVLNEPGVILRLCRRPPSGFFFYPNKRSEPVDRLPIHPGINEVRDFGELMFSETIPFECFKLA